MIEPSVETHVIIESPRIVLRCKYCHAPFAYLILQDGCYYIEIESRHDGKKHVNHVPIVAPQSERSAPVMNAQFPVGQKFLVNGTPLHNGDIVTVVEWDDKWLVFDPLGVEKGKFKVEQVLVPCFNPRYPETMYWWIHPCQLVAPKGDAPK